MGDLIPEAQVNGLLISNFIALICNKNPAVVRAVPSKVFFMIQMYKVFLNEKSILISENINNDDLRHFDHIVRYTPGMLLKREIETFIDSKCDNFLLLGGGFYDEACRSFNSLFSPVKAAGGIVRNKRNKLLFIRRHGIPDLPKGKLHEDETARDGALREVQEETGLLELSVVKPLESTFHIYPGKKGILLLKETSWFEMHYSGTDIPCPQLEEDITDVYWLSPDEAGIEISKTYSSLRELLERYLKSDT
jgi:8-oxo-dGTP pyrophosphatase MutT (NUDIX family)